MKSSLALAFLPGVSITTDAVSEFDSSPTICLFLVSTIRGGNAELGHIPQQDYPFSSSQYDLPVAVNLQLVSTGLAHDVKGTTGEIFSSETALYYGFS